MDLMHSSRFKGKSRQSNMITSLRRIVTPSYFEVLSTGLKQGVLLKDSFRHASPSWVLIWECEGRQRELRSYEKGGGTAWLRLWLAARREGESANQRVSLLCCLQHPTPLRMEVQEALKSCWPAGTWSWLSLLSSTFTSPGDGHTQWL